MIKSYMHIADGLVYDAVRIAKFDDKPILVYTVCQEYPYKVRIFRVSKKGRWREIQDEEQFAIHLHRFQEAILNAQDIPQKYKIFDPDKRLEYERQEKENCPTNFMPLKKEEPKKQYTDEELDKLANDCLCDLFYRTYDADKYPKEVLDRMYEIFFAKDEENKNEKNR